MVKRFIVGLVLLIPSLAFGLVASPPFTAFTSQGRPLVGASVNVTSVMTGLPATVYANSAGSAVYPGVVPASGLVQFYADAGAYRVVVSGSGVTHSYEAELSSAAEGLTVADFPNANVPGFMTKEFTAGTVGLRKFNTGTGSNPTATNDLSQGYSTLSQWRNISTNEVFVCADCSTDNAAVWKSTTGGGNIGSLSNIGSGAGVFAGMSGSIGQFRRLQAGSGMTVAESGSSIVISATGGGGSGVILDGNNIGDLPVWNGSLWQSGIALHNINAFTVGTPQYAGKFEPLQVTATLGSPIGEPSVYLWGQGDVDSGDLIGSFKFGATNGDVAPRVAGKIELSALEDWTSDADNSATKMEFFLQGGDNASSLNTRIMGLNGVDKQVLVGPGTLTGADTVAKLITQGISIKTGANQGFTLLGPGVATNIAYTWPTSSGTSGQCLTTDGGSPASTLTWASPSAGLHAASHDPGGLDEINYYSLIKDEASSLTKRRTMKFTGAGVGCADTGGETVCTITGGGGGSGITTINGSTDDPQFFATATTGTDFAIVTTGDTHSFNLPDASATARGVISTGAQTIAGAKTFTSVVDATAGVVSNEGGTSSGDFRAETDTLTHAFFINADVDAVCVNDSTCNGSGYMMDIIATGSDTALITSASSGAGLNGNSSSGVGVAALSLTSNGLTATSGTGRAAFITRNNSGSSLAVMEIARQNSGDSQPVLKISEGTSSADIILANDGTNDEFRVTGGGRVLVTATVPTSTTSPAYSFLSDTDTGLDINGVGHLILMDEGVTQASFSNAGIGFFSPITAGYTSVLTSGTDTFFSGGFEADPPSNTTASYIGFRGAASHAAGQIRDFTNTEALIGVSGLAQTSTGGDTNGIIGVKAEALAASVGTTDEAIGLKVKVSNTNVTGTLTDAIGIKIIEAQAVGTISNSFGIVQLGANDNNTFEGPITIGTGLPPAASGALEVSGNTILTGELKITGVAGSGKAVCVKSNGFLGECTSTVAAGGTCTCS